MIKRWCEMCVWRHLHVKMFCIYLLIELKERIERSLHDVILDNSLLNMDNYMVTEYNVNIDDVSLKSTCRKFGF